VTYVCDRSFSTSMTACDSGEGDCPVEVSTACKYVMNVEMAGWRYRAVSLRICTSLLLISSSSSLVSGNPAWVVVIHTVGSSTVCWEVMTRHSSLELRMMVSPSPDPIRLGYAEVHKQGASK
jgi:hypothetical protein